MSNQTYPITTESLIQSLHTAIEAKQEYSKAFDRSGGASWWYGRDYDVNNMNKAFNDFAKQLETYVDQIVQRRLDSLPPNNP